MSLKQEVVLCPHGYTQSGDILKHKLERLFPKSRFQLICPTGPYHIGQGQYGWWMLERDKLDAVHFYEGLEKSRPVRPGGPMGTVVGLRPPLCTNNIGAYAARRSYGRSSGFALHSATYNIQLVPRNSRKVKYGLLCRVATCNDGFFIPKKSRKAKHGLLCRVETCTELGLCPNEGLSTRAFKTV